MEPNAQERLLIRYVSITDLRPYSKNARTHSNHQIRQIVESIRVFGFTNPILVDRHNRIIAGHGRFEAAKRLGMTVVPTICLDDLAEDQIRAYVIADNKIAENAGWDNEILAIELQNLLTLESAAFDITVTGFEIFSSGQKHLRAENSPLVPFSRRSREITPRIREKTAILSQAIYYKYFMAGIEGFELSVPF